MPGLQTLTWRDIGDDLPSIRLATLATCRAAYVHPARVADLLLEVLVDFDPVLDDLSCSDWEDGDERWDEADARTALRQKELHSIYDEWQAEQARLRAACAGGCLCSGGREVSICIGLALQ